MRGLIVKAQGNRTQNEFAQHCGISSAALTRIKNGDYTPSPKQILKIAKRAHNGVTYEQLMAAAGHIAVNTLPPDAMRIDRFVKLPILGAVRAGVDGCVAMDEIIGYEEYPNNLLPSSFDDNYFILKVKGDSMYPKLMEEDLILVRKASSIDSGAIAIVLIDGEEGVIKKVVYDKTWIELHSYNREYPVRKFSGAEVQRLSVMGEVIKLIGRDL